MKAKITEAQAFNIPHPVDMAVVTQNASDSILSSNPTTAKAMEDGVITIDEYNTLTNTPEVVAKAKEVEAKANKYNTLKAKYDSIEDDTKAEFSGKPIPESAIDATIADRQKNAYKGLIIAK